MEGKAIADCWEWAVLPLVSVNSLAVLHMKCKSWKEKPWEGSTRLGKVPMWDY